RSSGRRRAQHKSLACLQARFGGCAVCDAQGQASPRHLSCIPRIVRPPPGRRCSGWRPMTILAPDSKLLFKGPDWDFDLIRRVHDAGGEIAIKEMGLDPYPNQIEVITTEQMLDAYASTGMPLFYRHWSFGKEFARNEALYRKGYQGLAYEIVINSNPCLVYIMEENSAMMQTLVIAHAGYGHSHFFKNNYVFKQWTDADGILDYLEFARG